MVEKFKSGDLSPISKVARIRLSSDAPSNNGTFSNRILAFVQSEELDYRGYRQWQDVGRNIKKGSKAVYIVRPHTIKKKNEDEGKDEVICVGFSHIPVFVASCTEDEDNFPGYKPVELPPLANVAKRLGIQVDYIPIAPDRLGNCNQEGSKIRLGTQDPKIFFHELVHTIHARIDEGIKNY